MLDEQHYDGSLTWLRVEEGANLGLVCWVPAVVLSVSVMVATLAAP